MDHLGRVVGSAAGRQGVGAYKAREADGAEIERRMALIHRLGEIGTDQFTVQLVAAVHRRRHQPFGLAHRALLVLGRRGRQAVDGDAAREEEAQRRIPRRPGHLARYRQRAPGLMVAPLDGMAETLRRQPGARPHPGPYSSLGFSVGRPFRSLCSETPYSCTNNNALR